MAAKPNQEEKPALPAEYADKKILLVMKGIEKKVATETCAKLGLAFEVADSFDRNRTDYQDIHTIVSGSAMMDYWGGPETKEEEVFSPIADFVKKGGHLVVLGCLNGKNMEHLRQFGITTGNAQDFGFEETPSSKLFLKGNEGIVPADRRLRSYGSFKCTVPHFPLLKRSLKGGESLKGDPAVATLAAGSGKITITLAEPALTIGGPDDSCWLITTMIGWIARGCPIDSAAVAAAATLPSSTDDLTSDFAESIQVELKINTGSTGDFKKLEAGSVVIVEGTVATVDFSGSKLCLSMNTCNILSYSLPDKPLIKPARLKLSAPSPKEFYGTLTAKSSSFGQDPSGTKWNAWLKQQYASLKGKRVAWQIPVSSTLDKTDEIKSLRSDLRAKGTSLTEMKKPTRWRIEHHPEWKEGPFIHPATDVKVPEEKTEREKAEIKALEAEIVDLNKLIRSKEASPLIVNPIETESENGKNDIPRRTRPKAPGRAPSSLSDPAQKALDNTKTVLFEFYSSYENKVQFA